MAKTQFHFQWRRATQMINSDHLSPKMLPNTQTQPTCLSAVKALGLGGLLQPVGHGNMIPSRHGQCNIHRPHFPNLLDLTHLLKMYSRREFEFGERLRPFLDVHVGPRPQHSLSASPPESGSPGGLGYPGIFGSLSIPNGVSSSSS